MRRLKGRRRSAICSAQGPASGCESSSCRSRSARRSRRAMRHIEFLDAEIAEVERLIATRRCRRPDARRLMSVPGVNVICAATFLAAIGDIRRFRTSRQLVGYLGLDPKVRQSGSAPAKGGRISKQGSPQARWALVEAAWSVVRQPGPMHAFYQRMRARRGHQIAIVATARKLACLFWCLLDPRRGLRPPAAVADRQEAPPARAHRRRPAIQQRTPPGSGRPTTRCARPSAGSPSRPRRPTSRWSATGRPARSSKRTKVGASVTPGRAYQRPSKGKVARQATSP